MNIHYLQHVPFEGLGSIEEWAGSHGDHITATRFFREESPPQLDQVDWLIVMGGPMSIDEEEKHPWLTGEKRYIEEAITAGKVVLGICLGAQLLADVLGARVYANRHKEIGWFPIHKTNEADDSPVFRGLPAELDALHWHGDTFELPAGAVRAFSSTACQNQAFVYNARNVALQFHLEMTKQNTARLIENCAHELVDGPYIQTADEMFADDARFEAGNRKMHNFLDRLRRETDTAERD